MQSMAKDPVTESGEAQKKLGFFKRNQFVFSLLLPAILLGTGRGFTLPVLPLIAMGSGKDGFGVGVAGASLMVIAPMAGGVLSTLPTGYIIDRFGRRVTLIGSPLISSASAFMVFFASSYWEFLLYLTIGGVAQQMWQMSRLAAIADSVRSSERGRQITSMSSMQRIGNMVGPFLGGILGELVGLRVPFLVFGVLAALAVIPSYYLIKETAPTVLARRAGSKVVETDISWKTLLTRPVITLFAAQFAANIARGGVQGNGGTYFIFLTFAYGVGPAVLGTVMLGTGVVGIPIMMLSGQIMDRFGRKRQIVPAATMLGLGISFMAITAAMELPFAAFLAAFIWINIGISMMAGTMQTLGADIAPAEARGKFFGVNRLIAEAGSLTNPVTFGAMTALLAGGAGFAGAFGVMAAFAFVAANLVGFGLRETLRKDAPEPEKQASG
jgi:MFS family permease